MSVYCPDCGEVEHQPIVEDSAHCPCLLVSLGHVRFWGPGGPCDCPCHKATA